MNPNHECIVIASPSSSVRPTDDRLQNAPLSTFPGGPSPSLFQRRKYNKKISRPRTFPVFTSPPVDLQRQTTYLEREEVKRMKVGGSDAYEPTDSLHLHIRNKDPSVNNSALFAQYFYSPSNFIDSSGTPASAGNAIITNRTNNVDDRHDPGMILDTFSHVHHRQQFVAQDDDQDQSGIRRQLQNETPRAFEQGNYGTAGTTDLTLPNDITGFQSSFPPCIEGKPYDWQAESWALTESDIRSVHKCGSQDVWAGILSGSDLHFNSTVGSPSMYSNSSASSKLAAELFYQGGDSKQENKAASTANFTAFQSVNSTESPSDSLQLTPSKQQEAQSEGKMATLNDAGMVKELNPVNCSKKRARDASESEGCKRCNCKKSSCLKLYCECFASGSYCLGNCSCKNCLNKPEHKDRVLDARKKLEARDPHAFAPKVIIQGPYSPAIMPEEGSQATPSSARHRRGCNCRKSKCVKRYCDCYQAGVGCSDGCRCEGCDNSFGVKKEPVYTIYRQWNNPSLNRPSVVEVEDPNTRNKMDISRLTPESYHQPGVMPSLGDFHTGERPDMSLFEQSLDGNNPLIPFGNCHGNNSPTTLATNLYSRNFPTEFGADSFLDHITGDGMP